ncbi:MULTISPECIES: hypothetical protein [Streptomyces]|uniref:Uncharacterized protein n=1 Tax=Streptomyces dengpaensis TaxID=2049881 RepID=A0ABM6SJ87_9ACTN|nr:MULTISPECIES: hypothetical protein [Streptomyces]AVH54711.1 hypothetical protein C4B68_01495 [Streptomyces dengpaensis]PIB04183.1 hypothetical protein B1C81_33985 [Streptomyces sp. HG99]
MGDRLRAAHHLGREQDTDDDLWDASPGLLTLPDGRAGTFMATSGPPDLVGVSGIGPAPFGPLQDTDAHGEAPGLAVADAPLDGNPGG